MKVLFVQNMEGIAGSEKYFWNLLPSLKKSGIEVAFLCVYKKKYTAVSQKFCDYLLKENISVVQIETKSYLSLKLLRSMKKYLQKESFDIIHSHLIYADFWSACLHTFFGVKTITVSTLHGYQENIYTAFCLKPNQVPKNNYYRIAKFAYKRIDYVYSCSEGLKSFFSGANIQFKNDVKVIYHGFNYAPIDLNVANNPVEFICAIPGRLIPRKGHMLILKNCKKLRQEIPGFKLIIIGDGELRPEFEKYVQDNQLTDCVEFTGNVSDVRPHLAKADLILIPSYAEGLPLVIFEAMSVSKTTVAFDTIGPSEVIENHVNGYLIRPFDDVAFAQKVTELSKNGQLLEIMGAAAKQHVETKFSLQVMTDNTIQFYQTCLNSRPFLTM